MKIADARAIYYQNRQQLCDNKKTLSAQKTAAENKFKETGDTKFQEEAATLTLSLQKTEDAFIKNQEVLDNIGEQWMSIANMESAKQQGDVMAKEAEDLGKVITVFRRLAAGDIVPASDEKKLMEYDWKMYQMAKNMQVMAQNEERKKHKSLWEDEEVPETTDPIETANNAEVAVDLPDIEIPEIAAAESTEE